MLFDQKSPVHTVLGFGRWQRQKTDRQTDIATYRLYWPRGRVAERAEQGSGRSQNIPPPCLGKHVIDRNIYFCNNVVDREGQFHHRIPLY